MRRLLVAVLVVLVAGVTAVAALADGAKSIPGAPPIIFGQQHFGNVANGASASSGPGYGYRSYWALNVRAGDRITIDWETQLVEDRATTSLSVYPTGTNDFNIENAGPFEKQDPNSGGRNEMVFTAPRSGIMPTVFSYESFDGGAGPYSFITYAQHAVRLALPRSLRLRRRGTLKVRARTPEGGVITDRALKVKVQLRLRGRWRTVGTAPVANSTAPVRLRISRRLRGRKVRMRAQAGGSGWVTRTTGSRVVRIR